MRVLTRRFAGCSLTLTQQIANSGEGTVWETSEAGYLAKIYHQPTPDRIQKLMVMVAHPPADSRSHLSPVTFAWPQDLLDDVRGQCVGFLMPKIAESVRLSVIYNPRLRNRQAPQFNWQYLHTTALNVALAIEELHQSGYVLGDIKPQNLLVNNEALVSIIDTDSFQVRNPQNGALHRCLVGSEGFTPVELLGQDLAMVDQSEVHDRFRLGVIIYLLLFGDQPFKGKWLGSGESPQPTTLIQKGYWPFAPQSLIRPGPTTIPLAIVHPQVQACFQACFTQGHTQPNARPSAAQWVQALRVAIAALRSCPFERNHHFSTHQSHCYWCDRKRQLGLDIFSPKAAPTKGAVSRQHLARSRLPRPSTRGLKSAPLPQPQLLTQVLRIAPNSIQSPIKSSWRFSPPSKTVIGGTLCTLSLVGLGLLLLPELESRNQSRSRQTLGRNLTALVTAFQEHLPWTERLIPTVVEEPASAVVVATSASEALPEHSHWDAITSLALSPDNHTLVSGSRDLTLKVWDFTTGELLATLLDHYEPIVSVDISKDGQTLVSVSASGKVFIWDLPTRKLLRTLVSQSLWVTDGAVRATAINAQGTLLASSISGGALLLQSLQTNKQIRIPSQSIASEQAIAMTPAPHKLVSSSSTGNLNLWDAQTGDLLLSFPGTTQNLPLEFIRTLALSPNGNVLASGSWSGSIRLWNPQTGQVVGTLSGHEDSISALQVSPDNQLLISAGHSQIKIWHLATRRLLRTILTDQIEIKTLTLSSDGRYVIGGGENPIIKVWDLSTGDLVRTFPPHP
ncbi:hypothetical protein GS597_05880 [Synechococcales cyanobacterium C]|uniref:Protein kinase domain-containing protein n=1 Tax=Petrachloros mirabilis ULC683 TaxID=2781853 RepID=A0A8K2A7K4_9CYAN|nr:hypothetical protein [Petrachloros mirabilis]NCJ06050.1 hypothetical protein [Petrachloros mirabilis ULC683]